MFIMYRYHTDCCGRTVCSLCERSLRSASGYCSSDCRYVFPFTYCTRGCNRCKARERRKQKDGNRLSDKTSVFRCRTLHRGKDSVCQHYMYRNSSALSKARFSSESNISKKGGIGIESGIKRGSRKRS